MTREIVENKIKEEIAGRWDISNSHGVDLKKCLIKPVKQKYVSFDRSETFELWTVLEASPNCKGYKIVYDEKEDMFGLGILTNKDDLMNLGLYGSFLNTLEAM